MLARSTNHQNRVHYNARHALITESLRPREFPRGLVSEDLVAELRLDVLGLGKLSVADASGNHVSPQHKQSEQGTL